MASEEIKDVHAADQEKAITSVKPTSQDSLEVGKIEDVSKDEAGPLAAQAIARGEVDPMASKKVLRKVDFYLLPFLCITYGLMYIDKSTLSFASVFDLEEDNHLHGQQFSWTSSIGYLVAEYPGVWLLQRLPVAKFLGVLIILWGCLLMITASTSSFAALATLRFLLGMTEVTINPGFITMSTTYYTRKEQASRTGIWISMICVSTIFAGVLTYAMGSIKGGLHAWQYIYLLCGGLTFIWGFVWLWKIPDNPISAKWLNEEERIVALQRVAANQTGTKTRQFDRSQVIEALCDIKIWLIAATVFSNTLVGGALVFQSVLEAGLGFTNLQVAILNVPYGVIGTLFAMVAAFVTHKFRNTRLLTSAVSMLPAIAGSIIFKHDNADAWARMVGVWLLASWNNGFQIMFGVIASNIAGSTKRSTANAMVFISYCLGPIIGPQLFRDDWDVCAFCVHATLNLTLFFV